MADPPHDAILIVAPSVPVAQRDIAWPATGRAFARVESLRPNRVATE